MNTLEFYKLAVKPFSKIIFGKSRSTRGVKNIKNGDIAIFFENELDNMENVTCSLDDIEDANRKACVVLRKINKHLGGDSKLIVTNQLLVFSFSGKDGEKIINKHLQGEYLLESLIMKRTISLDSNNFELQVDDKNVTFTTNRKTDYCHIFKYEDNGYVLEINLDDSCFNFKRLKQVVSYLFDIEQ